MAKLEEICAFGPICQVEHLTLEQHIGVRVESKRGLRRPGDSALSGVDRHGFAISQSFDSAHWRLAEETAVPG
jgi:hypothetical protein